MGFADLVVKKSDQIVRLLPKMLFEFLGRIYEAGAQLLPRKHKLQAFKKWFKLLLNCICEWLIALNISLGKA
jgi:hypothetical protein